MGLGQSLYRTLLIFCQYLLVNLLNIFQCFAASYLCIQLWKIIKDCRLDKKVKIKEKSHSTFLKTPFTHGNFQNSNPPSTQTPSLSRMSHWWWCVDPCRCCNWPSSVEVLLMKTVTKNQSIILWSTMLLLLCRGGRSRWVCQALNSRFLVKSYFEIGIFH